MTPTFLRTCLAHRQRNVGGDWLMVQIVKAYEAGNMPALLPGW
jgi:hypothetical protein